jgi:hypothetical protein
MRIAFLLLVLALASCTALRILPSERIGLIAFATTAPDTALRFFHATPVNSPDLEVLRDRYDLDSIAATATDELGRILAILAWTRSRWEHDGTNQPSVSNTLTILHEAEQGAQFRCVEYGIVLKSALAAIGQPARTLGLKTRDVERTRIAAGHVCTEVWSRDLQKWIVVDGQFGVMPTALGRPLNAVELQAALVDGVPVRCINALGPVPAEVQERYLRFIGKYLYFLDTRFDQREWPMDSAWRYNGELSLMLVPLNAKPPERFQRRSPLNYLHPTHSLTDFYRAP